MSINEDFIAIGFVVLISFFILLNKSKAKTIIIPTNDIGIPVNIPEKTIPNVIGSQDIWDEDNFAFITQLLELHRRGYINLLAIDMTGMDLDNGGSLIFSSLMKDIGVEVNIIVNHRGTSRNTPAYSHYNPNQFPNDGIRDSNRLGIDDLANIIEASTGDITYVVGGHVTNLESLLRHWSPLIRTKFKQVVVSAGWDTKYFKGETNLSGDADAVKATEYVWDNIPENIDVVMVDSYTQGDPYWNYNVLRIGSPLHTYITNGVYFASKGNRATRGDFDALIYGVSGLEWYDNRLYDKKKVTFVTDGNGRVKAVSASDKNHYLIYNANVQIIRTIFEELVDNK